MASSAGKRSNPANGDVKSPDSKDKGKGKSAVASFDASMEEDSEEDASVELSGDESTEETDEDVDMHEEDEEMEEEGFESDSEINPSAILTNRRRKPRVDYASKEAFEKAGLSQEEEQEE